MDLDNRLGPHLPAFDIAPNFGLGDVANPQHHEMDAANMGFFQVPVFSYMPTMTNGMQGHLLIQDGMQHIVDNSQEQVHGWLGEIANQSSMKNNIFSSFTHFIPVNQGIVLREPILPLANHMSDIAANDKGKGKVQNWQDDVSSIGFPNFNPLSLGYLGHANFEVGSSCNVVHQINEVIVKEE